MVQRLMLMRETMMKTRELKRQQKLEEKRKKEEREELNAKGCDGCTKYSILCFERSCRKETPATVISFMTCL